MTGFPECGDRRIARTSTDWIRRPRFKRLAPFKAARFDHPCQMESYGKPGKDLDRYVKLWKARNKPLCRFCHCLSASSSCGSLSENSSTGQQRRDRRHSWHSTYFDCHGPFQESWDHFEVIVMKHVFSLDTHTRSINESFLGQEGWSVLLTRQSEAVWDQNHYLFLTLPCSIRLSCKDC